MCISTEEQVIIFKTVSDSSLTDSELSLTNSDLTLMRTFIYMRHTVIEEGSLTTKEMA